MKKIPGNDYNRILPPCFLLNGQQQWFVTDSVWLAEPYYLYQAQKCIPTNVRVYRSMKGRNPMDFHFSP